METVKEAADSLLSKGEITQEEYNLLEEKGAMGIKKEGNLSAFSAALKGSLFPIAAIGATGVAIKEAIIDPIRESRAIRQSFKLMNSKVPQLAEKDQGDVRDYFEVIKTFSPKAASNPLVAGALVNKMMEFGGVDHKLVQDIAAIQAGSSRPRIIDTAAQAAATSLSSVPKVEG